MYLRHKSLEKVLSSVKELFDSGAVQSGDFVKVGFDQIEEVKSYWVFSIERESPIGDNKMIDIEEIPRKGGKIK